MTRQHKAKNEDQAQSSTSKSKAREGKNLPRGKEGGQVEKLNKCVWGVSPGEKGSVT